VYLELDKTHPIATDFFDILYLIAERYEKWYRAIVSKVHYSEGLL